MKKFLITASALTRIKERAATLPLLKNSIRQGEGSLVAYIGEEVVKNVLNGQIKDTYDYDIVYQNMKVDVKTKERTVAPKPYYECSVADFNTKQDCDYYVFVRIENVKHKWKRAWVLGAYDKESYFKDAKFLKRGQYDPDNGFRVKADCYNIPINKLEQFLFL